MIELSAWNLAAYSGQMLVVIAGAAVAWRVARPALASLRLAYWRLVVAACLALPILPVATGYWSTADGGSVVMISEVLSATMAGLQDAPAVLWASRAAWVLGLILVLGVAMRFAWLGIGLARLSWLRRHSEPAFVDESIDRLREGLAHRADLRWSDHVGQPATFGWRRPVILLPHRIADLSADARRAVVCHELLHVARGDWAWTLLEETVRSVLWFHPAMRWALGQLHLAREEAVDQEVVRLTAVRRPYLLALVDFASTPAAPALSASFVTYRHLAARVRGLGEESSMSTMRMTMCGVVLIGIVGLSVWASAATLPLTARSGPRVAAVEPVDNTELGRVPLTGGAWNVPSPLVAAPPVAAVPVAAAPFAAAPIGATQDGDAPLRVGGDVRPPRKIYNVNPIYPAEAQAAGVQGVVIMQLLIDGDGMVADVELLRSIPALDQAAIDAVWQWLYEPTLINGKRVELLTTVTVNFTLQQ